MRNRSYYLQFGKGLGRLGFYAGSFGGYFMPRALFRRERARIMASLNAEERREAEERAAYYCCLKPSDDVARLLGREIGDFKYPFGEKHKFATYFFDLYGVLRYFPSDLRFDYLFGDVREQPELPTFVKSRPITDGFTNSTILKLNSLRHYRWADFDNLDFASKRNMIVSRSQADQPWRRDFLAKYFDNPRCDIGHTARNPIEGHEEWSREFLSIADHLKFKFIACIEGNDVATNLKWVMSSNSLAVMPRPKFETWFAEGLLQPGVHYVEIADDYSDLIERLDYYASRPAEAEEIISSAHRYIEKFRNPRLELAAQLATAERYFKLTGQL